MLYPFPGKAVLASLSSCPHHRRAALEHRLRSGQPNLEGQAEGAWQLCHFPLTKSQKWQKVKADQHVKTLVTIKTFLFSFVKSPPGMGAD